MSDALDPFDIENIRSAEAVAGDAALRADMDARKRGDEPAKPASKHIPRSTKRFVKVPEIWWEGLAKVRAGGSTYRVAGYLLKRVWKRGNPVKLTNEGLDAIGVGRKGKRLALGELRRAGLVTVEERPKKSPIVVVKFVE
jgi:hypothetical protein